MKVGVFLLRTSYILHLELTLASSTENSRSHKKLPNLSRVKLLNFLLLFSALFAQKWVL